MITAFRANTPLMIFRQTSLVSNSYGSTTVTAPPCTAGSLRLTRGAGTALELGRPKSATLSESRQGLVVLAHRECQHDSPVDREDGQRLSDLGEARPSDDDPSRDRRLLLSIHQRRYPQS